MQVFCIFATWTITICDLRFTINHKPQTANRKPKKMDKTHYIN